MITSFKRIIIAGWQHFVRNSSSSLATIFVILTMTLLVAVLFLVKGAAGFAINSLQEKVDISVYFNQDTSEEEIFRIKDEISGLREVKTVNYVSREEALSQFMARYKNNQVVLESLSEVGNPLLSSLSIRAIESGNYRNIVNFLANENYEDIINKVDYYEREAIINRIFNIINDINRFGLIGIAIIALFAVLITFNTIRLAIYDSRNEIGIMRLVGASNLFIHGPFLLQGAIAGFFAFSISILIVTVIAYFATPKIESVLSGFILFNYLGSNFITIFVVQLSLAIGLGVLGSVVAVRKYLRV